MKRILFLIICLIPFYSKTQEVPGEKPNDFLMQCPSKYLINNEKTKFLIKYDSYAEVIYYFRGINKNGYYDLEHNVTGLVSSSPEKLNFGFYPRFQIYRETLKIRSSWGDGQCDLLTQELFNKALASMAKKEKIAEEEKQRLAEERYKKNKI